MMNQPQAQPTQGQAPQSGADIISSIDEALGSLGEALGGLPQGSNLAKRLMAVRQEYRAIMQEAASQGGGGQQQVPNVPEKSPIPDRSMGMPQSPAGPY
jgi:hypothetical protein